jgi:hypothetical protein
VYILIKDSWAKQINSVCICLYVRRVIIVIRGSMLMEQVDACQACIFLCKVEILLHARNRFTWLINSIIQCTSISSSFVYLVSISDHKTQRWILNPLCIYFKFVPFYFHFYFFFMLMSFKVYYFFNFIPKYLI